MKVIFLDFDGVLNHRRFLRETIHKGDNEGAIIAPECMAELCRIVSETGAQIVISTSWREHWDRDESKCDSVGREINRIFKEAGLSIFDKTPWIGVRHSEIEEWLRLNEVEGFVILDDLPVVDEAMHDHFVRTSYWKKGLDKKCADMAIEILR